LEASNHEQKLPEVTVRTIDSPPTPAGLRTMVKVQIVGNEVYLDAGGFPGRTAGHKLRWMLMAPAARVGESISSGSADQGIALTKTT